MVGVKLRLEKTRVRCWDAPVKIRVKICGVKRVEDMRIAAAAGADAIGLLVGQRHPSGDFISVELAARIAAACPPFVTPVIVTHVEDVGGIHALASGAGVSTIQVHSDLSPAGVRALRELGRYRLLKAYHVTGQESLAYGEAYRGIVDGFVLDSLNAATGQVGGTGLTHDWALSRAIVERYPDVPVILAGGLKPENVAAAAAQVRPYGVDVNSGTKGSDGWKNKARCEAFVREARQ
ncbi:MAG TPA: phosphoribosylanthranilate isomerase [Opitutaceae bacterium]